MLNAVLLEMFCAFAPAVAAQANGGARDATVKEREHQRLPNDGLTAGSVDKQNGRSVTGDAQLEFRTEPGAHRADADVRASHNEILTWGELRGVPRARSSRIAPLNSPPVGVRERISSMSAKPQPVELPPPVAMLQMIQGFWVARALYVAAKLGISDLLKSGPKNSSELAQATKTHAPSLYRLLRALDSVGVVAEDEQRRFSLTPLGATLRTDVPGSLRFFAIEELGENHYPAW